jgi:hypothetical protein
LGGSIVLGDAARQIERSAARCGWRPLVMRAARTVLAHREKIFFGAQVHEVYMLTVSVPEKKVATSLGRLVV